jgi:heat shock protein HslJ
MKKTSLFVLILVTLIASCTKKSTVSTTASSETALVGTYWKLIEVQGQPVDETKLTKPPFLLLNADGKLGTSAGCNTMMGGYTLKEPLGITFSQNMAATMMACPDMKLEDEFKAILTEVNNYAISGNFLSLSKNKMAPLARFEKAVQPK